MDRCPRLPVSLRQSGFGWSGSVLYVALICCLFGCATQISRPPATREGDVVDTLHGVRIPDPYRWLEDQDSPETREWIGQQNAYMRSIIDPLPGREIIAGRFRELLMTDDIGSPTERNGRYFLTKRAADQDQRVLYMREGLDGEDQVLVDPNLLSADHLVSVQLGDISSDGTVIAYDIRQGGADEQTIHLLNVNTREEYPDSLPTAVYFSIALTSDLDGYYYAERTSEGPRVYYHAMGTSRQDDDLVFGEGVTEEKIIDCKISGNGRWLILTVYHGSSGRQTELHYKDLLTDGPVEPLVDDMEARFSGTVGGDQLFIETDWEAPNSRILAVDLTGPSRTNWKEVVPEGDSAIESFNAIGGKLCVVYLENVHSVVKIFEPDGTFLQDVELPTIGSVGPIRGRWPSDEAFIPFQSFYFPRTTIRYDVASNTSDVWARREVPVDTDEFEVTQAWYTSYDSTRVPLFIVHRKDLKLDGSNPTLMYGYGGFNVNVTPYFSNWAVIMVELGGVYVLTNLRGGGEFGRAWHEAAMFEKKQNTFDDLYAAAEYLIEQGYTSSEKLAVSGGSNGGLLVGAAMTQRPELFKVIMCSYPLLDMLRYHKFLMGPYWVSEYGSADDPDQFEYIYEYSPYHNVRSGTQYPAVMFVSGDSDTRVDPMHARKMTALMQASTGAGNPIVLHYDTESGHSGGTPISKRIENYTDEMLFLLWQMGVTPR